MIKTYNEKTFGIDLIIDAYNLTNPIEIAATCADELDIQVSINEVSDYLNCKEDYEKESWTINSKEIFE